MSPHPPRRGKKFLPRAPDAEPNPNMRPSEWLDLSAQSLLEGTPDAMLIVNRAGEIVIANAQAERLFGYRREELIGRSVESLIPPRLRAEHPQHRGDFFDAPRVRPMGVGLDLFALREDGTEVPVEISLSPLTTESGTFVISAIRDATDRRRTEELKMSEAVLRKTRESEERFRLIADTAPVLIWMSDTDKLCTYFSKPWLDFTGRSMDSELGNGWAEGVHPEDLRRCMGTYTQAFDRREGFRMEYRLRRHDGEYRWILDIGVPRFDQDHSFVGYIGIGVDVTEHKLAERKLVSASERFHLAAQAGKMYAYEWDVATDMVMRSEEHVNVLGFSDQAQQLTRQQLVARVHEDDRELFVGSVDQLTPENSTAQMSYRVLRPDGSIVWLEKSARAFFDEQGRMSRVIGMVADITERKRAEEALASMSRRLIEAQEQERTRIARELHDDTNQRLTMLAIGIEQLKNALSDPTVDFLGRVDELRKQTLEISKDVQALSHELHSPKLDYLGIIAAIRSFCQEFAEQQKVKVEFKSHDVPTPVPKEISICLFRVLQEALHNSAKHSGSQQFEVQLWGASDAIHLTVSDSGAGFEPGTAMKERGLGLISMQERVQLLKGTLSIDSQPKRGTTIHARVPLSSGSDSMRAAG